jgi:hypothetical protein
MIICCFFLERMKLVSVLVCLVCEAAAILFWQSLLCLAPQLWSCFTLISYRVVLLTEDVSSGGRLNRIKASWGSVRYISVEWQLCPLQSWEWEPACWASTTVAIATRRATTCTHWLLALVSQHRIGMKRVPIARSVSGISTHRCIFL